MSNGVTIEVFTNTGNNYPPVQVIQVDENEQPIIVQTSDYYAPVQSVNGKIGFVTITQQDLGISGGLLSSGDLVNYVTKNSGQFINRPFVNGTGVLLSGEAAKLPDTIVYTTGTQFISGSKTFYADNYIFSGANVLFVQNTGIVSGAWRFSNRPTVNNTGVLLQGEFDLSVYATVSNLATTGSTLQSSVNTLTTNLATTGSTLANNLATTGSTLQSSVNTLTTNLATTGSTLANNLATTGSTLQSSVNTLTTNLATTGSTLANNLATTGSTLQSSVNTLTTNLATTGSTLQTKIDQSLINTVYTTGDQTILGLKSFGDDKKIILNPTGLNEEFFLIAASGTSVFDLIGTENSIDYELFEGQKNPLISGSPELNIFAHIMLPSFPPLTTGDPGIPGSITWDTGYFYICVDNNSWKKVSLNVW